MRRSYLKEGEVQLTALNSLLTQSRYLFLFSDLLLVAKRKAENSYKLKEKVRLDRLWIASNNCAHSFLIGWPICNFIAHFPTEEKKVEWHSILGDRIQRCRAKTVPKYTTLPLLVRIGGHNQIMKKKVTIAQTSGEILVQLVSELGVLQDDDLELAFDSGTGDAPVVLQGPEAVYCVVMDFVRSTGYRLSERQLERLDTFPLVQCRLVLFSTSSQRSNPAQSLVTHFKRVLSRSESRRFFGRHLDGSTPPQPVLTMIDYLLLHGVHVEGIFRKSPKQTTVRMLKAQLNRGSVPDFNQFSPHVTAAILKEYLRSIPGKLLQTCDLRVWMTALESQGSERVSQIRGFIQLLPSSHIVLLAALLRLLRAVAQSPSSKMNAQSLAVCIAPSLLDSPKMESAARRLPQITEWLIQNAPLIFDNFTDAQLEMSSSASNDSGLSDVEAGAEAPASPDLREADVISSSTPASSVNSSNSSPAIRCKIHDLKVSPSSCCSSNISTDDEMEICAEIEKDDEDKTPVLSRENSTVERKPTAFIEWKTPKRERFLESSDDDARWRDGVSLRRRETLGGLCRRREDLKEEKSHDKLLLTTHRALEPVASVKPTGFSQEPCKGSGKSWPFLPKYVITNSDHEELSVSDQAANAGPSKNESPKSALKLLQSLKNENQSHPNLKITTSCAMSLSPKTTTQRSFQTPGAKYEITSIECQDIKRDDNAQSFLSKYYYDTPLTAASQAHKCSSTPEPKENQPGAEKQMPIVANKLPPCPPKKELPESRQHPSTSKICEEKIFLRPEVTPAREVRSQNLTESQLEHRMTENAAASEASFIKEKFVLRHPTKLSPVQQKLRNRAAAISLSHQTAKSPFPIDLEIRVGVDDTAAPAAPAPAAREPQPTSSLTISLPLYRVPKKQNSAPAATSGAGPSQQSASSTPAPQQTSAQPQASHKTVDRIKSESGILRERRESFRKERKKNRSILMDPLEVNWSVDELRLKFQGDGGPPPLNTEYSPNEVE